MAHVIALQGPSSSGKTSTLIQVFQNLKASYPTAKIEALHSGTVDIKIIMRGVNGKIVGIESQGDPNSRLQQSLKDFIFARCDIIFCACRTRGMTAGWVNALSPRHQVEFVKKNPARNHAAANAATAASLIKLAGL